MSYSTNCPHCKAVLKSPTPIPEGKKVKCPKCKQMFTTAASPEPPAAPELAAPAPPAPPPQQELHDDEMDRAIAALQGEHGLGGKPAPAPTPQPAAASTTDSHSEDDEMAAAIAKLEAEQTFGNKPAPAAPPVAAAPVRPVHSSRYDTLMRFAAVALRGSPLEKVPCAGRGSKRIGDRPRAPGD